MPVVGSGPFDNAEYVLNLSRSLVNDAAQTLAGNLLSDSRPYTFPMLNAAYRQLQIDLTNNGYDSFWQESILAQFPAVYKVDPQTQEYINYTGSFDGYNTFSSPVLPANMLLPLRLWERPSGSTQDYQEMLPVNDGLPSRPQTGTLQQWEWRNDSIYFVGVMNATDIRIRYLQFFSDLVDGTSIVNIPWSDRALAYLMGRMYGAMRGSPLWTYMQQNYDDALTSIVQSTSRKKQRGSHRRRPYGSSTSYWQSTMGWW